MLFPISFQIYFFHSSVILVFNNCTFLYQHGNFTVDFLHLYFLSSTLFNSSYLLLQILSSMEVSLSYLNNPFIETLCSKSPHLDTDKNDGFSPRNETTVFQSLHFTQNLLPKSQWLGSSRGCEPSIIWSQMLKAFLDSTRGELWTVGVYFLSKSKKSLRLCLPGNPVSCVLNFWQTGFYPRICSGKEKEEWEMEATVQYLSLLFSTTEIVKGSALVPVSFFPIYHTSSSLCPHMEGKISIIHNYGCKVAHFQIHTQHSNIKMSQNFLSTRASETNVLL